MMISKQVVLRMMVMRRTRTRTRITMRTEVKSNEKVR